MVDRTIPCYYDAMGWDNNDDGQQSKAKHDGILSYPNIYFVRPEFQLNNSTEALYSY